MPNESASVSADPKPPAAAAAPPPAVAPTTAPYAHPAVPHRGSGRAKVIGAVVIGLLLIVGIAWFLKSLGTVSTDDAFISGHVTFVAPRVSGQVSRVLVEDNNRVRKGDLLVQLDKEPYLVQLNIAKAAVD